MLEALHPPLGVRTFNTAGRLARRLGLSPLRFEPGALRRWATRETGLHDFGEAGHEEALAVLCRSLEDDAALSMVGRISMRNVLRRALRNRLHRIAARRTHPEALAAPLTPPLIVLGMPRSGTTFLHRLLCLADEARPLRTFELQQPFVGPGRDRRLKQSEVEIARLKAIAPSLDRKHYLGACEPEECMWLLNSSLVSLTFWVFAPVYGYLEWYLAQDHHLPYRAYREHLQLFAAEDPARRLTLKAPVHTAHIDALFEALPEAMVVQTHRDPKPVLASTNSLFFTLHSVMSEGVDIQRTARTNLEMLRAMMEKHLQARPRHEHRILDIHYDDLVGDPLGTLKKVHAHYKLPFDAALEDRVRTYLAERKQHRFGRHPYSLEETGLREAEVDAAFAAYRERLFVRAPS